MFFKSNRPPSDRTDPFEGFPTRPSDYGDAGIENSLVKLYEVAIGHADRRIKWYDDKADAARWASRRLRSASLIFFALGTIAPIASNIFAGLAATTIEYFTGQPELAGSMGRVSVSDVGYIFLALAGGLVVFDQFFEYSASWTRYRQSQARLERLRADLRYTWASRLAAAMHSRRTVICTPSKADGTTGTPVTDTGPDKTGPEKTADAQREGAKTEGSGMGTPGFDACAVVQLVEILRTFVNAIEQLAEAETVEWAERFRARIQAFDEHALRNGPNGGGPNGSTAGGTANPIPTAPGPIRGEAARGEAARTEGPRTEGVRAEGI